jgi:hypothetical protein
LKGQGCPACAQSRQYYRDKFISRAKQIHGDKYDYSLVDYAGCHVRVTIVCPKHGPFTQTPKHHLGNGRGRDCPQCAYEKSASRSREKAASKFVDDARSVHGQRYNYTKSEYVHSKQKLKIICPDHGEFEKSPNAHLKGQGCPKCTRNKCADVRRIGKSEFIRRSNLKHDSRYDYSNANYRNLHDKIEIICPDHGSFFQLAYNHLNGSGCPICPTIISKPHQELIDFVRPLVDDILINDRSRIYPLEIDVLSGNIGIEMHGLYYHSYDAPESRTQKERHHHKWKVANESGIMLLQIFEDEWIYKRRIVESMIRTRLGLSATIGARNCRVVDIDHKTYRSFCESHHVYGCKNAKYRYGLIYDNNLMSIMSFNRKGNHYEMERLCSKLDTVVVGGASKLYKHFISEVRPTKVVSYCDLRYGTGAVYENLGMVMTRITRPNYFYINGHVRQSRIKFQKHKLAKILSGFDDSKTESENMFEHGYRRIWDAGHMKFEWTM